MKKNKFSIVIKVRSFSRFLLIALTGTFLSILLPCDDAFALAVKNFYTGVRQLGMGGAYTAVVNDETALVTNPAGLGKLRDFTFTFVDPELSVSAEGMKVVTATNATSLAQVQGLLDTLKNNPGKHWYAKGQVLPSFVSPNFGLGLFAKQQYEAEVNSLGTNFRLDFTNDYAAVLGYCFRFLDGRIKLGVSARFVDRTEIAKDIDPSGTAYTVQSLASEGAGIAADAGLILTFPIAWLPAIAGVVRDVGGTSFSMTDGVLYETTSRPADELQRVDVGISVSPILSNNVRMTITADYHNVTTSSEETDQMRRVHAGVEFNIADFLFVRGGMNQRYYTAGIELASERFQLQVTTYGEEVGTPTAQREDRRYVAKIALRL